MSAESDLYEFLASLEFSRLPASTVESCQAVILDHLACALLGMRMPWTQAVRRVAVDGTHDSSGAAFVYGEMDPMSATKAALINGTAGHALDLDDLYFPAMSHPGCVVIPAAVAAGLAMRVDGHRLLASIVGGYEVMGRIGRAAGLRHGELGFHATGQHGPAGAAAAVATLCGADARLIQSAVGVAASLGAGIKAFTNGPGMVKRLHAGRAAEAGVLAASLARAGFDGPVTPLTGKFGLIHVLGCGQVDVDTEALSRGLSEQFVVDDVYIKPYAACGALHGAIRAAEELAKELEEPDLVERVVVGTSQRALDQNSDQDPEDAMSVQYSMECCVALGLLGHAHDPLRSVAVADDPEDPARVLAHRVTMELDHEAERAYPDPNMSRVDVYLSDGSTLSRYGRCDRGTSSGWDVAVAKFSQATRGILKPPAQRRLVAGVLALSSDGSVADLLASTGSVPSQPEPSSNR